MTAMRAAAAVAALVLLALATAGCGSSSSTPASSESSGGAASLVPRDAAAYISVDLTQNFPGRDVFLSDVPDVGDEVDIARLGKEVVAFAKPDDPQKLRDYAAKKKYTVQKIGDWYVVADSQELFDRVRAAQNGDSLADNAAFKAAWGKLDADALARAYAPKNDLIAQVRADGDVLRAKATLRSTTKLRVAASPLLRDIPTGAALAASFHGGADLIKRVPALAQLAPLLRGDGVLYVRPAGLVPELALELATPNPQKTLTDVRALLRRNANVLGPIPLTATVSAGKVVVSDGASALTALRSGPKLVDDASYKDAVRSAGAPSSAAGFVYADVTALAPFIQLAAQAIGGKPLDPGTSKKLEHLGTVVAWVTRTGSGLELHAWLRPQ